MDRKHQLAVYLGECIKSIRQLCERGAACDLDRDRGVFEHGSYPVRLLSFSPHDEISRYGRIVNSERAIPFCKILYLHSVGGLAFCGLVFWSLNYIATGRAFVRCRVAIDYLAGGPRMNTDQFVGGELTENDWQVVEGKLVAGFRSVMELLAKKRSVG